jgi:hypothetical protein
VNVLSKEVEIGLQYPVLGCLSGRNMILVDKEGPSTIVKSAKGSSRLTLVKAVKGS